MKRTQRQYLVDVLEAMAAAEQFVAGKSVDDLDEDLKLRWAVERAFSIIGEAVKKIDADLKARYPQIPWRDIAGMRDVVVHGYWAVRRDVIWNTIQNRFPREKPLLQRVLDELPPEEDLLNDNRS